MPDLSHRAKIAGIFKCGDRALLPNEVPEHLLLSHSAKTPRDIFQTQNGAMVVSKALRDLIEKMDPGVHQFAPISISNIGDHGGWSILNVYAQQDSIVDEESDVEKKFEGGGAKL